MTAEEDMNPTVKLLRLLGSPFAPATNHTLDHVELTELHRCSRKNRMLFLFLETVNKRNMDYSFALYQKENIRRLKTNFAIARLSWVLTDSSIKHAVFKTIRPYESTTVDIDVLIFGNTLDYERATQTAQNAGYGKLARGPMSTTFLDPKMKIGVDLYNEVAVSHVPYIDKDKLVNHIVDTELAGGEQVKTFTPEADLLAIIAHSIIKENMYTLSEYYSYIYYLKQLNINNFLQLMKETHLKSATRTHTAITALLHESTHKIFPNKLQQILDRVGVDKLETARVTMNCFRMPHKYHPVTIARSLLEIVREKKTKKGLANQIAHSFKTEFLKDFLKKLKEHMTRETY